jgi:hypothetical protein
VSGWLLAAVPAIAFLALTKMVLTGGRNPSAATDPAEDSESGRDMPVAAVETHEESSAAPAPVSVPAPAISAPVAPAAAAARPVGVVRPVSVNGAAVMPR